MDPMGIGTVIGQRWRVTGVARQGGASARLDAVALVEGRCVSILQAPVGRDALSNVQALAEIWKRVTVDGLAPLVDLFADGDNVYVVRESASGRTLEERVEEGGPLSEAALLDVARAICDVLERLHGAGVVSGAIAPDTVVVSDSATLLELDPLRALRALSRGRPVDPRVDVHGLGRVLRYAATGVAPPDLREGPGETVLLAPMHASNESISPATERAVTEMLRTEPSRRPSDVAAVRALLFPPPSAAVEAAVSAVAPLPPPAPVAPLPPPAPVAPPPPPAPVAPPPPPALPVVTTAEVPRVDVAPRTAGTSARPRSNRRVSYGAPTIALVTLCFLCAAWVARLLYAVTDEARVRVDPRFKPPAARPRLRVVAPRSPYPPALVGSDGTVMLLVPEGDFPLGVPNPDHDDGPQISDSLDAFYIDRTEVTAAQFARFVQLTGWVARGPWRQYVNPEHMDLPVAGVTVEDAEEYARWLGKRLPTEQEWEKAARGSKARTWPWGDSPPDPRSASSFAITSDTVGRVAPVGSCPQGASPSGALDMAGNVWEWTASDYLPYSGTRAHEEMFGCGMHVIRGGSWNTPLSLAKVTTRMPMPPRLWAPDVGFRCVLPLK